MQIVKMSCNNCGANLDVDLDHLQAYCPYCGQKLLIDFDTLGKILVEREKTMRVYTQEIQSTKRVLEQEKQKTERARMEYNYRMHSNRVKWDSDSIVSLMLVLMIIGVVVGGYLFFYGREQKHKAKIAQLQQLEVEIDEDIKNNEYDAALLNVNKLYCDDHWSDEEIKAWDAKRESYLKLITEKKKEQALNDPNVVFMPSSSSYFKNKKYQEVMEQFQVLGFTNVSAQVSLETPGIFDSNDGVEHILIDGKTEFEKGDYFKKDTSITIYYYEK